MKVKPGASKAAGQAHNRRSGAGVASQFDPHAVIRAVRLAYRDAVDPSKASGPVKRFSKEEIDELNRKLKDK